MEKRERNSSSKGTKEELSQFWNNKVHPITGYTIRSNSNVSKSERERLINQNKE